MKAHKIIPENGQSLVIIALGLVAFVAMLALVLDGANAYAAKRQAQNAADAGALAGATYMCKNHDMAGGINQAEIFAVNNGAVNPPEVYASLSAGTVVVTATVERNTFFAGVIGFDQVTPRAVAAAECRPPVGMGVLPVAWACRSTVVGGMNVPGEDCAQKIIDDCGGNPYDLNCTYILMDSVKVQTNKKGGNCDPDITDPTDPKYCYSQNDLVCSVHGPDVNPAYACDYVAPNTTDCDLNNDCIDELMTGGARSWLDLNGGGGGASELLDWIRNGFPDPIPPHKWIPEESGVATSIFHTVASAVVGEDVILPVFNNVCNGVPTTFENPELYTQCAYGPPDDLSLASSSMNFHIITFAQFHVTCVQTGKNKVTAEPGYVYNNHKNHCNGHEAALNNGSIDDNDKTIEGYFEEVDLGGYSGPGDWFDTGTFTVVLIR
ncbi:MAG: Tad domain-containing protein [Anaerolineales bacterium]